MTNAMLVALGLAAGALTMQSDGAATAKQDKLVCRKIEVIGSNLPKQECHHASEWKAIDTARRPDGQDRSQLDRMVAQGTRADGG